MLKGIYEKQGLQGWSEERFAELKGTYYDMISQLDERLGELVAVMKETGVYDGTALFFFSDHGDFTGDYGLVEKAQNTFYDCQCNVPLIIKPPAGTDCRPRVSGAGGHSGHGGRAWGLCSKLYAVRPFPLSGACGCGNPPGRRVLRGR